MQNSIGVTRPRRSRAPRARTLASAILLCAAVVGVAPGAAAQFYSYPSFDVPRTVLREYNFALADGPDAGTSLIFQWRESTGARSHLKLDVGLADPNARGADARLIIGGTYALQMSDADAEFPLDLQFTAGLGGSFGGGSTFYRIPFGLSVGHRFALDAPFAITPYAHPRIPIDICSRCGGRGRSDATLGVDVDLGVDFELSRSVSLRASALFAGSDFFGRDNSFGVSLAWTPRGLR